MISYKLEVNLGGSGSNKCWPITHTITLAIAQLAERWTVVGLAPN